MTRKVIFSLMSQVRLDETKLIKRMYVNDPKGVRSAVYVVRVESVGFWH